MNLLSELLDWIDVDPACPVALGRLDPDSMARCKPLLALGALRPGPPLADLLCPWCSTRQVEPHFVPPDRYRAICSDCGWIDLDASELSTAQVDLGWLAAAVARAMHALPSDPCPIVPDLLWAIGERVQGDQGLTVLLARVTGATTDHARIVRALDAWPAARQTLVLATRAMDWGLDPHERRRWLALPDVVILDANGLRLHAPGIVDAPLPPATQSLSIDIAPDGRWLQVNGRQLRLQGKQCDFALVMVAAYRDGLLRPTLEWALRRAGYGAGTSELKHVTKRQDFFRFFGHGNGEVWIKTQDA